MTAPQLAALLAVRREDLLAFARRHGGPALRHESPEDLVQGIHVRVLERSADYEHRGEAEGTAWIWTVARNYLHDRRAHWTAMKRRPAALVRITSGGRTSTGLGSPNEPASPSAGPSTFASRREQLEIAVRALALLLPRDRDLVGWHAEGVPLSEQAARLGVSYEAAERAHLRAIDRFRKAHALLVRRG